MQRPTCTNTRIRSSQDAHKIFFAAKRGILPMVTRRLDMEERAELCSGCIYVWEERSPHTEVTGLGIERFTEGRRWSPSRVRDEFLFYYEKWSPPLDTGGSNPVQTGPPSNWEPLVKQTYSVYVDTDKGSRKWHLTAYFTQASVDQLGTVDTMEGVGDVDVPEGMFQSTRLTKRKGDDPLKPMAPSSHHTYAPFHPQQMTTATSPYAHENSAYYISNPVLSQSLHRPPPSSGGGSYSGSRSHPSAYPPPRIDAYPTGAHSHPSSSSPSGLVGQAPAPYGNGHHHSPRFPATALYEYPSPPNTRSRLESPAPAPTTRRRGMTLESRTLPPVTAHMDAATPIHSPLPSRTGLYPPIVPADRSSPPVLYNPRYDSPVDEGAQPVLAAEDADMTGTRRNAGERLVPLRNLLRNHPYRRDPVDDRVLRKFDPRSPS